MNISKYVNILNAILFLVILLLGSLLFLYIKTNHNLHRQLLLINLERSINPVVPTCEAATTEEHLTIPELIIPAPNCGKIAKSTEEIILSDLNWKDFNFHGKRETSILMGDIDGSITSVIEPDVRFPKDFPKAAAEVIFHEGGMQDEKKGCYALLDLNLDGQKEIFITRGVGANGLGAVAILEKKKNKWHKIYHGPSVLILHKKAWYEDHPNDSMLDSSYPYITEWRYDAHKYWQIISAYNGQEYQEINGQDLPWAIAGSDSFRSMFWEINLSCPSS